jgi:hypothetical protein
VPFDLVAVNRAGAREHRAVEKLTDGVRIRIGRSAN